MPVFLKRLKLEHGAIEVDSTPRRVVVRAAAVAGRQPDTDEKIRGPPAKVPLCITVPHAECRNTQSRLMPRDCGEGKWRAEEQSTQPGLLSSLMNSHPSKEFSLGLAYYP